MRPFLRLVFILAVIAIFGGIAAFFAGIVSFMLDGIDGTATAPPKYMIIGFGIAVGGALLFGLIQMLSSIFKD
ncbi:hypothetical protein ACIBG8_48935 [Nonomuraea sp. NPDC050556]|uniref:hypothetical protein n=1 Tax=Nonomuraea sp. NPDC050556 TaxID=3364369 RepID=UPI0037B65171